jgi:CBS domain-containing protein
MEAKDVMTTNVITVPPDAKVEEIADLLLTNHISVMPVVESDGKVIGIVSEGDLLHRHETETERHRSWWLTLFTLPEERARDYVKAHGRLAKDIMTSDVATVTEHTALSAVAEILEKRGIKRVPVTRNNVLVGIVSRANLLRGLVARKGDVATAPKEDDRTIRDQVLAEFREETGSRTDHVSVIVENGVVHLWGLADTEAERDAMRVAAEQVGGVGAVESHVIVRVGIVSASGA